MSDGLKKSATENTGNGRTQADFLAECWATASPGRLETLGNARTQALADDPLRPCDPLCSQEGQERYNPHATGVSALRPCDPSHNGGTFSSPSKAATPGSFLSSLSLRFADDPRHHIILSRYCELADLYHQQHGLSISDAASHAHTGVLFEYGDGGAAAMLRPEILDKLPRSSAPMEQMHRPPPQKELLQRKQQLRWGW